MQYKSALGSARGLGSAKDGTHHWWWQRVTAVFLAPLFTWFIVSLIKMPTFDLPTVVNWFGSPLVAIGMTLIITFVYFHAFLGMQVIIEDYVHSNKAKFTTLIALKALMFVMSIGTIFAIVKLHFLSFLVS